MDLLEVLALACAVTALALSCAAMVAASRARDESRLLTADWERRFNGGYATLATVRPMRRRER